MSNAFLQLPAPVGNGVGPTVDVSALSSTKTVLVGGSFSAVVSVETSSDGGTTFGPAQYTTQGPKFETIELSATHMRLRVSGRTSGTPVCFVGSAETGTKAAVLNVPAGNGSGTPSDISDFTDFLTFVVSGPFGGTITVEASDDGTNWSPLTTFNNSGTFSVSCFADQVRVTRSGVGFDPGLPAIAVAASGDSDAPSTPAFVSPSETITIYARLTGNDTTGRGTLLLPYRTFQRAILDVPMLIPPGVYYVVDITGLGTEVLPDDYALPPFQSSGGWFFDLATDPLTVLRTDLLIKADPVITAAVPAADATIALADILSTTVDPVTFLVTITLVVPRASWAANALKGKFLSGGDFFNTAPIASSTATTLELASFDVPVGPFLVCDLSTKLETGGDHGFLAGNVNSVQFIGITFDNPTGSYDFSMLGNSGGILNLCDFKLIALEISVVLMEIFHSYWHDHEFSFIAGHTVISNTFIENAIEIDFAPWGALSFRGVIMDNSYWQLFDLSAGGPGMATGMFFFAAESRNSPVDGVLFQGGRGVIENVRISDAAGNAITTDGAGTLQLITVEGTGNTGFGVQATNGAQVIVDVDTDVTGVAGDMKIGNMPARTWVNFRGVAPVDNEFDVPGFPAATAATTTGSRLSQP